MATVNLKAFKFRYWVLAFPDIVKPIGGVKQLHRVCEIISSSGRDCILVQDSDDFHPGWFHSNVKTTSKDNFLRLNMSPDTDIVILPETYLPAISTILNPDIPKIVFNQNASYSFGLDNLSFSKPSAVIRAYNDKSIYQIWCVSHHDRDLLVRGFNLSIDRVKLITNALDLPEFTQSASKKKQILYMPRKNYKDTCIVSALFGQNEISNRWKLLPLHGLHHSEVISLMRQSLVYFSFGSPEGFGLPVAEAMACGCAVVGYTGLGGRELFNSLYSRPVSFQVECGDWLKFITSLSEFDLQLSAFQRDTLNKLEKNSLYVIEKYSFNNMSSDVLLSLQQLELSLHGNHY